MQIEEVTAFLKERKGNSAVLFCHHNADLDSLCSAYAFGELLKRVNPGVEVTIAVPGGLSKLSRRVAQDLDIIVTPSPSISPTDIVVLLDVNTLEQLAGWGERIRNLAVPLLIIDHHAPHPETQKLSASLIVDEDATSTAEIVYRLWRESGIDIARHEALALFLGIAYDTRHFALAKSDTFRIVVDLIDRGVDVEKARRMVTLPMELSERLARLKAADRAKIHRIGEWIIAVSEVNAFQASAARALLRVGVDVAIVGGETDGELRISLRATQGFFEKTGLHLGRDVAAIVGKDIDGAGGGHGMAAGVNGKGDLATCLGTSLRLIREKLVL